MRRIQLTILGLMLVAGAILQSAIAAENGKVKFTRVSPQFIAALGDPDATSGTGAESWGLWPYDPGPRGVWLQMYPQLKAGGGYGPGNWKFNDNDWWLDENGLIMEQPQFPIPVGQYLVTGAREVTSILTIHPKEENGEQRWDLVGNTTLYDVTHLECRSARYTPVADSGSCSPENAPLPAFKVSPGAEMPDIKDCAKQDYTVLIIIGVGTEA